MSCGNHAGLSELKSAGVGAEGLVDVLMGVADYAEVCDEFLEHIQRHKQGQKDVEGLGLVFGWAVVELKESGGRQRPAPLQLCECVDDGVDRSVGIALKASSDVGEKVQGCGISPHALARHQAELRTQLGVELLGVAVQVRNSELVLVHRVADESEAGLGVQVGHLLVQGILAALALDALMWISFA